MTLIDFESDPVDLVDQPAGTGKGHSKFPNDLLDLDFTKSSADLQMEQVQGLKDSGIAQDDLNIEYEGFAEETEVVKQQIDDFSSGSSAPDDVVVDEVDSEVGLVEPINSLPTEPTFAAEFVSVATAVISPEPSLVEKMADESSVSDVVQEHETSFPDLKKTEPLSAEGFADFGTFTNNSPTNSITSEENLDSYGDSLDAKELDSDLKHEEFADFSTDIAADKDQEPKPLENFAKFPSIEDSYESESSKPSTPNKTLETSPSFKILSDLDQELDTLNSESPLASSAEEPLPKQSMTLNLHESDRPEEIHENSLNSQSLVEHKSWLNWKSIFCLK